MQPPAQPSEGGDRPRTEPAPPPLPPRYAHHQAPPPQRFPQVPPPPYTRGPAPAGWPQGAYAAHGGPGAHGRRPPAGGVPGAPPPGPYAPGTVPVHPGIRLLARVIDTSLFVVLWFVLMLVATGVSVAVGGGDIEGQANTLFTVLAVVNFFVLPLLLEWAQVGLWGRSIGKVATGLRVVRTEDGGKVGAGRALVRALLYSPGHTYPVNLLVPWSVTNVLWQFRDRERRRCLHDRAARTVVVQGTPFWAPSPAHPSQPGPPPAGA